MHMLLNKTANNRCVYRKIRFAGHPKWLIWKQKMAKSLNTTLVRSSRPEVSCKKSVLENFVKFTGKHLRWSIFFNKVAGTCNLLKRDSDASVFLKFAKFAEYKSQGSSPNLVFNIKAGLSIFKKVISMLQWKPFKNDEKCFLFHRS